MSRLADLLNLVEKTGRWPAAAVFGKISLADKGEGSNALNRRPITVLSLFYRLWALVRMPAMSSWLQRWVHESCHARPGSSCTDSWYMLSMKLEHAHVKGYDLSGVSVDWQKAHDTGKYGPDNVIDTNRPYHVKTYFDWDDHFITTLSQDDQKLTLD